MFQIDTPQVVLMVGGAAVMTIVMLRGIAQGAIRVASQAVDERRALAEQRLLDNAEAEAAGRAAALEPLSLNPDGSIEEPIIGVVETL